MKTIARGSGLDAVKGAIDIGKDVVRVLDPGTLEPTESSDDERRENDRFGPDALSAEVGGYLVGARREDAWDAILALLVELSEAARATLAEAAACRHDWIGEAGRPDRDVVRGSYRRTADFRASATASPASTWSKNLTPLTTRPRSTSKQGIIRFVNNPKSKIKNQKWKQGDRRDSNP